mmetsp:Transcript_12911/g.14946  ORF Transcript_12911/g.14946 Transcript_12911/m.14946 type:complete len:214 (-) Transcript_12911:1072-1713(-)
MVADVFAVAAEYGGAPVVGFVVAVVAAVVASSAAVPVVVAFFTAVAEVDDAALAVGFVASVFAGVVGFTPAATELPVAAFFTSAVFVQDTVVSFVATVAGTTAPAEATGFTVVVLVSTGFVVFDTPSGFALSVAIFTPSFTTSFDGSVALFSVGIQADLCASVPPTALLSSFFSVSFFVSTPVFPSSFFSFAAVTEVVPFFSLTSVSFFSDSS